jgi:hypothetical protein
VGEIGMDKQKVARELVAIARELLGKGKVPEAFKKQWKKNDKGNGKDDEKKDDKLPDFLKKKKALSVEASDADVYDKLRDLVVIRTPPEYEKAANLVKSSRRFQFDYMKDMYRALVELAKMQKATEKKHDAMRELWFEIGRREDQVRKMTRR